MLLTACGPEPPTIPDMVPLQPPATIAAAPVLLTPPPPSYTVELLPRARLRITSMLAEDAWLEVVWRSDLGGTYREAFPFKAGGTREVWPDCFYWGRYSIHVEGWTGRVDYGPGVPYCY